MLGLTKIFFISILIYNSLALGTPKTIKIDFSKEDPKKSLQKHSSNLISRLNELNTDLILIGEDHRDGLGNMIITQAILQMSHKTDKICYFIESSMEYQPVFDQLPINPQLAIKLYQQIRQPYVEMFHKIWGQAPTEWMDFNRLTAISYAGYRILAVDSNLNEEWVREFHQAHSKIKIGSPVSTQKFYFIGLAERNLTMSENIHQAFKTGLCEKAVMVVGKAHIYRFSTLEPYIYKSLDDLIKLKKTKVDITECRGSSCKVDNSWSDIDIIIDKTNL